LKRSDGNESPEEVCFKAGFFRTFCFYEVETGIKRNNPGGIPGLLKSLY
jgi:hypothetical protein